MSEEMIQLMIDDLALLQRIVDLKLIRG